MSRGEADARSPLAHDSLLWRRFARFGAARGPRWFVEYSPPLIGVCAAVALPSARHAVRDNLRRIRGPVGRVREARDVAATFASYAGCLAEVLSNGSKNAEVPHLEVAGRMNMDGAIGEGRGVVVVTAHTAGWELVGPVLKNRKGVDVVLAMEAERDAAARELQDHARHKGGISVAHVGGGDAFSSLPLLRRLRSGAAIALQVDRVPDGMRGIGVRIFDREGAVPEGPLRLAEVSGAPIVPFFCARLGFRRYVAEAFPALRLPRRPSREERAEIAQSIADAMTAFIRRHPTQWFDFGGAGGR